MYRLYWHTLFIVYYSDRASRRRVGANTWATWRRTLIQGDNYTEYLSVYLNTVLSTVYCFVSILSISSERTYTYVLVSIWIRELYSVLIGVQFLNL